MVLIWGRRGFEQHTCMYCCHWAATMWCHDYRYMPPTDVSPEQNISDVPSLERNVPTTVYDVSLDDESLTDGSHPWTDRNVNSSPTDVSPTKVLDIAFPGQSVLWMLCPWPNHPLIACDWCYDGFASFFYRGSRDTPETFRSGTHWSGTNWYYTFYPPYHACGVSFPDGLGPHRKFNEWKHKTSGWYMIKMM